jgi:molecular chaperone GrpE
MSKKEKEIKKKCNCAPDCTCGCQEGKECTCDSKECQCGYNCKCGDNCECGDDCNCKNATEELLSNRIKELEDSLLRSQAELLNYRKRKDEETARILKYAEEDILNGFLPILDNFERAITMDNNNFGDETSKFLEGFRMVYNQTKALLEKFEVREIECLGKEFDPATSQAIATEKDKTKPSGVVLKVYQKGYMYKDKVLRHAMVIVNE